jgi:hypothetical protein
VSFKSRFSFLVFVALLGLIVGCHHDEEKSEHSASVTTVNVSQQGREFRMPSKTWDLLLRSDAEQAEKKAAKKGDDDTELTTASFLYAKIEVELKEKTPGVLREPAVLISLPDGGGEIDLAKWTTGKTGTFFVKFLWEGQEPHANEPRVVFYSRAKKRRVGDQVIGSGCKSFMNLTSYLLSGEGKSGIAVNTTRNFHSTVLGGHFLFSWMSGGVRKLTHVTFQDSENPHYFCEKEK